MLVSSHRISKSVWEISSGTRLGCAEVRECPCEATPILDFPGVPGAQVKKKLSAQSTLNLGIPSCNCEKDQSILEDVCVDYRRLNSKTVQGNCLHPHIAETLDKMPGAYFYLVSEYHQIKIAPED